MPVTRSVTVCASERIDQLHSTVPTIVVTVKSQPCIRISGDV